MSRIPKPWRRTSGDNAWYVQIDGKQIYLGKDKKAAFEKFRRIVDSGKLPSAVTVRNVLDEYWKWLSANKAPETVKQRESILRSFGESVPPTLKAEDLTPGHVQRWIDGNSKAVAPSNKRAKKGRRVTKRDISPSTKNTRITFIIGVFNWAKRMRYVADNPIAGMPKPAPTVREEFVPNDLWPQVLALASDDSFRDLLTVLLSTGCRVTEIMRFEAKHYNGYALVLPIKESKGRKRSRVVFLADDAKAIVERLVAAHPDGKLFRNRRGAGWNRNSVRCRFRRLKEKLKMPWLTATHLRHSFAHHRLSIGQDALTVAKLMGHVDTSMLALRYGHLEQNTGYMIDAANQTGIVAPLPSAPPTPNV